MEVTRSEASSEMDKASAATGRFAGVYKVVQAAIDSRAFPGCAFGVLDQDQIVLADALGNFTYEPDDIPVRADTVFDIASLTKVISTTAIGMLLFQDGQLHLNTPLGDLLPGFIVGRENTSLARRVTLGNLLAHNSGLPGYVEFFRNTSNPASLFRACLELPINAPPGEHSEYSDPGFILLGKALEVLTGESLWNLAQSLVFQPLRMTATRFRPVAEQHALIPPTEVDETFRHRRIQGEVQDENAWILDGVAGHAGLFSNVPDLLAFARSLLNSWNRNKASETPSLFTRETIETFSIHQPPTDSSRALGWDTPSPDSSAGSLFSRNSIGHLGYSGCSIWIDLDASIAAVLLTNRTWPDRQSQEIRKVRPAFHDAVRQSLSSV